MVELIWTETCLLLRSVEQTVVQFLTDRIEPYDVMAPVSM